MRQVLICLPMTALICLLGAHLASAGFFPDRPVYDYNKIGTRDCSDLTNPAADHGRCGPTDGPVFNSFINVPSTGDERYFFDAFIAEATERGSHADPLRLGDAPTGQRIVLRVYVDNDANEHYGPRTTARNARLRIVLPTVTGNDLRAVASVSADNATPKQVDDSLDLLADRNFRVRYVPGSAIQYRGEKRRALSDSIITNGVLIGDAAGDFTAGFDNLAIVEAQLEVLEPSKTTSAATSHKPPAPADGSSWKIKVAVGSGLVLLLVGLLYRFWKPLSRSRILSQVVASLLVAALVALATIPIAALLKK